MDRRAFLATLGLSVATMASSCGFSLEDGLFNPCLSDPLPERLRSHKLVRAAWDGIQPSSCWDCHVHLAGVGDGDDGVWITPQMKSLLHPWQNLQHRFYLNAACTETEGRVDEEFVRRLEHCLEAFPSGAKIMLLAFDFHHDVSGARRDDLSAFRIADRYAAELAQRRPDRMEWICSIHPYREDVLEALAWAAQRGARAVKWLPSAMGMDPASPRCDVFYDQLTRLKLPLLTHAGAEQAVHGGSIGEYNNPLRLRRPLERGVRVIMAHCASLGEYTDTDRGADGPKVPAFALFARLMDEPRYQGELYGDISATVQSNRVGTALATLLARNDWHPRLINGSDYPLPGVLPLVSMRRFVEQGYLKQAEAGVLAEIRRYNPLLFDFVLKRSLVKDGGSFAPQVFESRRAFVQEA